MNEYSRLIRENRTGLARALWLCCAHLLLFAACGLLAFLLRFDFSIPAYYLPHIEAAIFSWLVVKTIVFSLCGSNRGWSHFNSTHDLLLIVGQSFKASLLSVLPIVALGPLDFPRSVYAIDFVLTTLGLLGLETAFRFYREQTGVDSEEPRTRTLIYGAGRAGELLLQDISGNPRLPYEVVGFVDDDPAKRGAVINGASVLGPVRSLAKFVPQLRAELVLIAVPSASGPHMTDILQRCYQAGVRCKTVPSLDQILLGSGLARQVRDVAVEDLLARNPVRLDEVVIGDTLRDKVVLVTGAGGSIGSELCRQIARFQPRAIVGYEISENALYELNREMISRFADVPFFPAIGCIRDDRRLADVMAQYQPRIVYHAAAFKHVPMMESHPFQAIENNVFGTLGVARAAAEFGVERFVLISSDKAVRPTNVMGATKRVTELIVNAMRDGRTKFVAVRFGNVLGSNGSVIPLFKEQIAAGGPLTVTHPDMQRYFMTIGEAVQLVLQASAMGRGGEIFVLDMGKPVRIVDLARNLILLSGLQPDRDVAIEFTGARPGEKLCEEITMLDETTVPTRHGKIRIFTGPGLRHDELFALLEHLRIHVAERDAPAIINWLQDVVSDYHPSGHVLAAARSSEPAVDRSLPLHRTAYAVG